LEKETSRAVPETISELRDRENRLLACLSFSTERDIITQVRITTTALCSDGQKKALDSLAGLIRGKAVMAADLVTPDDILHSLGVPAENADDEQYYYALMALLTLKNALSGFADYRAAVNRGADHGS
jgi:hypothetical protein